jgi:hypothetical protein
MGAGSKETLEMTGSNVFSGGFVTGSIDDSGVTLGVMANGFEQATFSGKLDGESISGEWQCPGVKDEGVWHGTLNAGKVSP